MRALGCLLPSGATSVLSWGRGQGPGWMVVYCYWELNFYSSSAHSSWLDRPGLPSLLSVPSAVLLSQLFSTIKLQPNSCLERRSHGNQRFSLLCSSSYVPVSLGNWRRDPGAGMQASALPCVRACEIPRPVGCFSSFPLAIPWSAHHVGCETVAILAEHSTTPHSTTQYSTAAAELRGPGEQDPREAGGGGRLLCRSPL